MRKILLFILVATAVLSTAGCGFHTRGKTQIPAEMKTMILNSNDPYGPLARTVRQQLRLNNISLVDDNALHRNNVPSLRLENEQAKRDTASIFINGTTAEYQLQLLVNAQVLIPGKGIYPLHTTVYRSFFDNSGVPLAKDAEQDLIYQEMRTRAAEQLVRELLAVHIAQLNTHTTPVAPPPQAQPEVISSHPANDAVSSAVTHQ